MKSEEIERRLRARSLYFGEESIAGRPTVIGYEKVFKWRWLGTQLNTFIFATDLGPERLTRPFIEEFLVEAFRFAEGNHTGWPRGLQSGLAAITILTSEVIDDEAALYCLDLKTGKKCAGFVVPVAVNTRTREVFSFRKKPVWGGLFFPHFKTLIHDLTLDRVVVG